MTGINWWRVFHFSRFFGLQMIMINCSTPVGGIGGSLPVNAQEIKDYKVAMRRCFHTGGTRIVKIGGELKCF